MKKAIVLPFIVLFFVPLYGQNKANNDYIEFDDRKNVVHGVYIGFNAQYGKIENKDVVLGAFKIAYVANQKLEIGFAVKGFSSESFDVNNDYISQKDMVLVGGYGGLHVEPILFGKRFISVSFPLLVGGGLVGYFDYDDFIEDEEFDHSDYDDFFVVEQGINILYNFSRFTQVETGIRYRFTSEYDLFPYKKGNLNGFSVGIGLKVGIFNMGRNKKIKDNF